MSAPALFTVRDFVERAGRSIGGNSVEAAAADTMSALDSAYRILCQSTDWKYFYKKLFINTSASYSTGTVAFDFTGGTYERMLTLTTGTWPSWALYGTVRIASVNYEIATVESSTIVTLRADQNPGADVASTTYILYRSTYTRPPDFRRMHTLSANDGTDLLEISYDEWMALERHDSNSNTPARYAITGDRDNLYSSMAVSVWPYPQTASNLVAVYQCYPRDLLISGYGTNDSIGTVTVSSGSASVTGSGTAFSSSMIGSVIRFGTTSTVPTGKWGLDTYTEQRIVMNVTSTTALTLDANASSAHTAVKYVVSDPIDISVNMIDALIRGTEFQLRLAKPSDAEAIGVAQSQYYAQVRQAMEADKRSMQWRASGDWPFYPRRLARMPYTG